MPEPSSLELGPVETIAEHHSNQAVRVHTGMAALLREGSTPARGVAPSLLGPHVESVWVHMRDGSNGVPFLRPIRVTHGPWCRWGSWCPARVIGPLVFGRRGVPRVE